MCLYLHSMKGKAWIYDYKGMIAWHAAKDEHNDHTGHNSSSLTSEQCFLKLGLEITGDPGGYSKVLQILCYYRGSVLRVSTWLM